MRTGLLIVLLVHFGASVGLAKVGLISTETLQKRLPEVIVIDARKQSQFLEGHIPGSLPMEWEDWTREKVGLWKILTGKPGDWGMPLPKSPALEKRLRAYGLTKNKEVVVVGHPNQYGEEGRIAWNLLYWGIKNVSLLNGGFPEWKKHGYEIETGKARFPKPSQFKVKIDDSRFVDLNGVRENLSQALIVDARTKAEYRGKKVMGQKRGGHLPNAKLFEFSSLYRDDGKYVSKKRFLEFVNSKQNVISYCTGGVRSALFVLLFEHYTGKPARNYAGSIWEWSANSKLKMVVPR